MRHRLAIAALVFAAACGGGDDPVDSGLDASPPDSGLDAAPIDADELRVDAWRETLDGGDPIDGVCGDAGICEIPPSRCADDTTLEFYEPLDECAESGTCSLRPLHHRCFSHCYERDGVGMCEDVIFL